MKLYGLTGGIGSGKSTVSKALEAAGIPVISADALNAQAAKEPHIQKCILDRFGTLDRMELRKVVFGDPQAKKDMEAIMHPEVQLLFFKRLEELSDQEVVIYDSALIFELNQERMFESVILVDCPAKKRIARIRSRDNMNEEIIQNIIRCQMPDEERRLRCDMSIRNEGSLEDLQEQVNWLILQIRPSDSLPSPSSSS